MRANREQALGGVCHLFNCVPIWGLIFCGWAWFAMREESRFVVRQARAAMSFHGILLAAMLVWLVVGMVVRLIGGLAPALGTFLNRINDGLMLLAYLAFVGFCLAGACRVMSGGEFRYPLEGGRRG